MAMTLRAVEALIERLPEVEIGTRWGRRTWMVGGHGFAWVRPLGKTDVERLGDVPTPQGDILAVTTENLDAKDALLSMELPGFFTIQHFNNFPAVLIELRRARAPHVRAAIVEAHRLAAARPPRSPAKAKKPRRARRPARAR